MYADTKQDCVMTIVINMSYETQGSNEYAHLSKEVTSISFSLYNTAGGKNGLLTLKTNSYTGYLKGYASIT